MGAKRKGTSKWIIGCLVGTTLEIIGGKWKDVINAEQRGIMLKMVPGDIVKAINLAGLHSIILRPQPDRSLAIKISLFTL